VTGRNFQALPTQTDTTTTVAFRGVTENNLLWAGVCPGRPGTASAIRLVSEITGTEVDFFFSLPQKNLESIVV